MSGVVIAAVWEKPVRRSSPTLDSDVGACRIDGYASLLGSLEPAKIPVFILRDPHRPDILNYRAHSLRFLEMDGQAFQSSQTAPRGPFFSPGKKKEARAIQNPKCHLQDLGRSRGPRLKPVSLNKTILTGRTSTRRQLSPAKCR